MQGSLTLENAAPIAAQIERKWIEATLAGDTEGLAALFTEDIVFLGSNPRMYIGRGQLLEYLAGVPIGGPMTIAFSGRQLRLVGPEAFTTTSYVTFAATGTDGAVNRFRWAISWMVVARNGAWGIVQHHASSRPEE